MTYYVYLLLCRDGTYYCGSTNNLEKRILQHNQKKGAKYTRGRTPVRLIHQESFHSRGNALRRERVIKKLSRSEKEHLIASSV